jgi:hypothetical protein
MAIYGEVSLWFHKERVFRQREDERMYRREPSADDIAIHKALVLRLITDGEHLSQLARQADGLISNPENIKAEDLTAAVEALRDTYRSWHTPMPSDQKERILNEVFRDVA